MDEVLADRDRVWCKALIATLGVEEIQRVVTEFNRIRPDAAQQSVQRTGLALRVVKKKLGLVLVVVLFAMFAIRPAANANR